MNNLMTFKCHKTEENGQAVLYPVYSIGFNSRADKLVYTAGGDGIINFWDVNAKQKIRGFNCNKQPVTKVSVSPDGNFMAYAVGNDWARGVWSLEQPCKTKVCVHQISDQELKFQKN